MSFLGSEIKSPQAKDPLEQRAMEAYSGLGQASVISPDQGDKIPLDLITNLFLGKLYRSWETHHFFYSYHRPWSYVGRRHRP